MAVLFQCMTKFTTNKKKKKKRGAEVPIEINILRLTFTPFHFKSP